MVISQREIKSHTFDFGGQTTITSYKLSISVLFIATETKRVFTLIANKSLEVTEICAFLKQIFEAIPTDITINGHIYMQPNKQPISNWTDGSIGLNSPHKIPNVILIRIVDLK